MMPANKMNYAYKPPNFRNDAQIVMGVTPSKLPVKSQMSARMQDLCPVLQMLYQEFISPSDLESFETNLVYKNYNF